MSPQAGERRVTANANLQLGLSRQPRGCGARGDPVTSGALAAFRASTKRRDGRSEKPLPAGPLPWLPPPRQQRDNARPLFRRGLGRGGRIRARAFRPQPPPPRAGRAQVVFRGEGRSALLYNNGARRAGGPASPVAATRPATPPPAGAGGVATARGPSPHLPTLPAGSAGAEAFLTTPTLGARKSRQAPVLATHPPAVSRDPGVPRAALHHCTGGGRPRVRGAGAAGQWGGEASSPTRKRGPLPAKPTTPYQGIGAAGKAPRGPAPTPGLGGDLCLALPLRAGKLSLRTPACFAERAVRVGLGVSRNPSSMSIIREGYAGRAVCGW